ncbi:chloride channel protein [Fontivita pretiosa]|uniref:chloride channel protein n=1 Tax=Fontivita pretiosa TaxID=2989684 RepID=UPI003D180271
MALTTEGLPVSVSIGPALAQAGVPPRSSLIDSRVVLLCAITIVLAVAAALLAEVLVHLIALFTNVSFYGRFSFQSATPTTQKLGWMVILVPVIGGIVVGLMARYGSRAIRGHGIPEAMEQVLLNQSRIPPRMTFLKPLSAAVAIGTGGPFGAEGPIIATGGALGSLIGQLLRTTAAERKTLLAAGAAAGMSATFGSPVSAVLLAVELLLFEFRPRSLIPVALASTTAAATRMVFHGVAPVFAMPDLSQPSGQAMAVYVLLGAVIGAASVLVTRIVYAVEDLFELLPVHWMWWPAIGAVAVGVVGYFFPRTLGVGYFNISDIISAKLALGAVGILCLMKFASWSIALGSGTSGGTLAPLFTIGGAIGALLGAAAAGALPGAGVDLRVAALVGMAAIFAGASRALLASVVFAFETTLQPLGLLPLLGGCSASFLISCLLMRNSIMTEKIARRGVRVPAEYAADFLDQVLVRDACSATVVALRGDQTLAEVREWINSHAAGTSHQGFPILDEKGKLLGVLTRRNLLDPVNPGQVKLESLIRRPPIVVYDDCTLREAADHMVNHDIGRLPVIRRAQPGQVIGMITRSDLLRAQRVRLEQQFAAQRTISLLCLAGARAATPAQIQPSVRR